MVAGVQQTPFGESLDRWFVQLDSAGYRVGIRERLRVETLFARLATTGDLPADHETAFLLARPLLCTQPDEQRKYPILLRQFISQGTRDVGGGSSSVDDATVRGWLVPHGRWEIPLAILAVLFAAGLSLLGRTLAVTPQRVSTRPPVVRPPTEPPVTEPEPVVRHIYVPVSTFPIETLTPQTVAPARWARLVRATLTAIGAISLFGIAWIVIGRWRRQLYLQGTRTDKEVEERLLTDPNPTGVETPAALARRATRILRQRYAGARTDLDIPATLRATMQAHGTLSPRYAQVRLTPEYVALIDRRHPADHHAAYSEALIAALQQHGLAVQVYYFEGSPDTGCWRRGASPSGPRVGLASFAELAGRYWGHRLLVFADAHALTNDVDGAPRPWTAHLNAFPQRAWLTPMPLASWASAESAADSQGFLVLPVQPEALSTLADWFSAGQLALAVGDNWPLSFPPLFQGNALSWITRLEPPPPQAFGELLFQLRAYLGAMRFQWLCACAIFPAVSPAITLSLGRELTSDARELALGLAAIGALPWFRHGFMPAWLRLRLLEHLDGPLELRLRQVVTEKLEAAVEGPGVELVTIAQRSTRLAAWLRRQRGVARDVVLVDFIHRGPLSRLAQRLPDGLRRRLFRQGSPAYGVRGGVLAVLPVGLLASMLALPGVWRDVVVESPNELLPPGNVDIGTGVRSLAMSPDGRRLAITDDSSFLRLMEMTRDMDEVDARLPTPGAAAAFDPDAQRVVTADRQGLRLWDLAGRKINELTGDDFRSVAVGVASKAGDKVALGGNAAGDIVAWQIDDFADPLSLPTESHKEILALETTTHLSVIAAATSDGIIRVGGSAIDTIDTWKEFSGHRGAVRALSLTPDGDWLVSGGDDRTVRLWDLLTLSTTQETTDGFSIVVGEHTAPVTAVALSPDGRYIASGDQTGHLVLWDRATRQALRTFSAPAGRMIANGKAITKLQFSPDGRRIVSGSADGQILFWGPSLGSPLDIVDCANPDGGVSEKAIELANLVADAVRRGELPEVSPAAYDLQFWKTPDGFPQVTSPAVYYGALRNSDATAITRWLERLPQTSAGTQLSALRSAQTDKLGRDHYVVFVCPANADTLKIPRPSPQQVYTTFENGIRAFDLKRWAEAATLMRGAATAMADTGEKVLIDGTRLESYVPTYFLGIAQYQLQNFRDAIKAFDEAESLGGVKKNDTYYTQLRQLREQARAKLAAAPTRQEPVFGRIRIDYSPGSTRPSRCAVTLDGEGISVALPGDVLAIPGPHAIQVACVADDGRVQTRINNVNVTAGTTTELRISFSTPAPDSAPSTTATTPQTNSPCGVRFTNSPGSLGTAIGDKVDVAFRVTPSGCAWKINGLTTSAGRDWLDATPASGNGDGIITVTVIAAPPNDPGIAARRIELDVSGSRISFFQRQ